MKTGSTKQRSISFICFYLLFKNVMLGIKPEASHMLSKHSITELPTQIFLKKFSVIHTDLKFGIFLYQLSEYFRLQVCNTIPR